MRRITKCPKCNTRHKDIDHKEIDLPMVCQCGFKITKDNINTNIAHLHKIELYVVDPNAIYMGSEDLLNRIDTGLVDGWAISFNHDTTIIEWNDNIDLNSQKVRKEDFEKYFNKNY